MQRLGKCSIISFFSHFSTVEYWVLSAIIYDVFIIDLRVILDDVVSVRDAKIHDKNTDLLDANTLLHIYMFIEMLTVYDSNTFMSRFKCID